MTETNVFQLSQPGTFTDPLTAVLRNGARALLAQAVEAEAAALLASHADNLTEDGRRRLVRHGHLPEREVMTGIGPVAVRCPRVRDRVGEGSERIRFSSAILPPYLRRTKSLEELIPWLYLKGVSTGDFSEALQAILGPDATNLSATTITRLKAVWEQDHEAVEQAVRELAGKHYVYVWADGVQLQHPPGGGAAVHPGPLGGDRRRQEGIDRHRRRLPGELTSRGGSYSWSCKARGLEVKPHLAIGDGALGFWKAMRQVWDTDQGAEVLGAQDGERPGQAAQGEPATKAKRMLHDIYQAESRAEADKAFDLFVATYEGAKYPKATECLVKDRGVLLTFYNFPAEHWKHLRTTNVIEKARFASGPVMTKWSLMRRRVRVVIGGDHAV